MLENLAIVNKSLVLVVPSNLQIFLQKIYLPISDFYQLTAKILPAVNQVRLAPGVYQEEVVDYCREKGILLEAWGPFGQGELFDSKEVQEIAANHGKSVAQLALAWSLAEGFLPLPKSVTASRIQANLDCFGIELSHEERETLKAIAVQSGAPRVDDMDF